MIAFVGLTAEPPLVDREHQQETVTAVKRLGRVSLTGLPAWIIENYAY